jgi:hypothetical protein
MAGLPNSDYKGPDSGGFTEKGNPVFILRNISYE